MTQPSNATANASVNAKMGVFGWLTIIFVILKLDPGNYLSSPVEDWSWWLVLLPLYFWFVVLAVGVVIVGIIFLGVLAHDELKTRKRRKQRSKEAQKREAERLARVERLNHRDR